MLWNLPKPFDPGWLHRNGRVEATGDCLMVDGLLLSFNKSISLLFPLILSKLIIFTTKVFDNMPLLLKGWIYNWDLKKGFRIKT